MSRRNIHAPVGYTCPNIDGIIAIIKQVVNEINHYSDNDDLSDEFKDTMGNWASELNYVCSGRSCDLENLRNSNSSLRDWGYELAEQNEDLKNEIEVLNGKISDLEDVIGDLEDQDNSY